MPHSPITRDELKSWLDEKRDDFVLIDTALPEHFAAAHLPGAQNACVFEVTFLDQVGALEGIQAGLLARATGHGPVRERRVVVYGSSERSLASADAAEKLVATGFEHVRDYRGGLADWHAAGLPVEGDSASPQPPPLQDRDYVIDPKTSTVEWIGRSPGGKHQGTIEVSQGVITVRREVAVGGRFTLDMTTIVNTDLINPLMKGSLERHLQSEDFFDVKNYPQAHFTFSGADPMADAAPGLPNYTVRGRLVLKGVDKPVTFPAQIGHSPEGDGSLVARANFDFDRTQWNVLYGSGRFYENLGKHLVNDLVTLDLKIVAR